MQVQNPHNIKYNGTIQGLKYIWKTEGFRGLFKGNGTNCARIVPNSAVKFFSYEQASKYDSFAILILGLNVLTLVLDHCRGQSFLMYLFSCFEKNLEDIGPFDSTLV